MIPDEYLMSRHFWLAILHFLFQFYTETCVTLNVVGWLSVWEHWSSCHAPEISASWLVQVIRSPLGIGWINHQVTAYGVPIGCRAVTCVTRGNAFATQLAVLIVFRWSGTSLLVSLYRSSSLISRPYNRVWRELISCSSSLNTQQGSLPDVITDLNDYFFKSVADESHRVALSITLLFCLFLIRL